MTASQLRHLTLTDLPWTFSSETLYFAPQDPQIIFIVFSYLEKSNPISG